LARELLPNKIMRSFLIFVVFAGLGGLYLWQKHNEQPAATVAAKPTAVSTPQLTPAPRGVASEHNWMKRSLDRAADVTEKSRERTKQSQEP
jgi:hypothetical protein